MEVREAFPYDDTTQQRTNMRLMNARGVTRLFSAELLAAQSCDVDTSDPEGML